MNEPVSIDPLRKRRNWISSEAAYLLPMAIFLLITQAQTKWPIIYAPLYAVKTLVTAVALVILWKNYTKIRWNYAWLGAIVGVTGIVQWIGMQLILEKYFPIFQPSPDAFNPINHFANHNEMIAFIAVRLTGAVLVVPVMEELFWRDYLWRQILSPNDFKLASVGEWGVAPFLIVSIAFATVHANWCLTAIVWAMMIGGLLIYTKSLGACIIAHATTNLLLGFYVLKYHAWGFW